MRAMSENKRSSSEMNSNQNTEASEQFQFDVAISYASEDRAQARAVAAALIERNVTCFYDEYFQAHLWGENLYTKLTELYQQKARYCVIFCSQHYAKKVWTRHELEAAQARALQENEAYILPIRLDETPIPGLLPTLAYLRWPKDSVETIADNVMIKLGRTPYVPRPQP